MISMKTDGKYRILMEGEHLPVEIDQNELRDVLTELKDSVRHTCDMLSDIYYGYDIIYDIVKKVMYSACLNYDDGKEWHLNYLADEIENILDELENSKDEIPSIEDSELLTDYGFKEAWYEAGYYEKILEDSDEKEVVEEVILEGEEPRYRKRTIIWEHEPGVKHSKEIRYEDLEIDELMERLIQNTKKELLKNQEG